MVSGSSQASSMISRMRETGIELAIDEGGGAGVLPIRVLVSLGRNEFPPLPVCVASIHRRLAGPLRSLGPRTGVGLSLDATRTPLWVRNLTRRRNPEQLGAPSLRFCFRGPLWARVRFDLGSPDYKPSPPLLLDNDSKIDSSATGWCADCTATFARASPTPSCGRDSRFAGCGISTPLSRTVAMA
jgi:hypothetical protein